MKRRISYGVCVAIFVAAAALAISAPDPLSVAIVGIMTLIVLLGEVLGIFPLIQYSAAFGTAVERIHKAQKSQGLPWTVISKMETFFDNKLLDRLFDEYKKKVEQERKSGMIVGEIDEAINEDELALRCWQGVLVQIPGTLTGLGLLGTFIGLITGINSIEVSSVDATLSSIQQLFSGIQVAFYTSIAGVILSILFNMTYKILWNLMVRDLGLFRSQFQRNVIPSVEEQQRYSQRRDMEQIQERLDRLPQGGDFSLANTGVPGAVSSGNESVLMPQVLAGLQNNEFTFFLQPRYDLNTQQIIGAEALVRWHHAKLGMVAPSVFIPLLESNGYITKLDQYIWKQICAQMRQWIDAGIRPVPISVNISKTDILALNLVEVFTELVKKYRLPPRCIEFDIAQNAYLEAGDVTLELEKAVQEKGFRVVVDGFKGDFFALSSGQTAVYADAYKLDLRYYKDTKNIISVAQQAHNLRVPVVVEGIENMEQMSVLRKNGITEGQGFYLSKAVSIEEFEKMMKWRQDQ